MRAETKEKSLFTEETSLSSAAGLLANDDWVANSVETQLQKKGHGFITVKEARSNAEEIRSLFRKGGKKHEFVDLVLDNKTEAKQGFVISEIGQKKPRQVRFLETLSLQHILFRFGGFPIKEIQDLCGKIAECPIWEIRENEQVVEALLNMFHGELKAMFVSIMTDERIELCIEHNAFGEIEGVVIDNRLLAELIFLMNYIEDKTLEGKAVCKVLFKNMLEIQRKLLKKKEPQIIFLFLERPTIS